MEKFFADYLKNLEELHHEVLNSIKDLPQEALDWSPFPGENSINVLVTHIAGAEKFWLGDVVAGESTGRDREAEFKVKGFETDQLRKLLDESLAYGRYVLEKLNLETLDSTRVPSPRDGKVVSIGWSLGHILKHTAIHLGQIQIMRDFWANRSDI